MTAVAEGLVGAFSTAAESDSIADFIRLVVGRLNGNAAANPQRSHFVGLGIFYQADGGFKFRFKGFSVFIPRYQPA